MKKRSLQPSSLLFTRPAEHCTNGRFRYDSHPTPLRRLVRNPSLIYLKSCRFPQSSSSKIAMVTVIVAPPSAGWQCIRNLGPQWLAFSHTDYFFLPAGLIFVFISRTTISHLITFGYLRIWYCVVWFDKHTHQLLNTSKMSQTHLRSIALDYYSFFDAKAPCKIPILPDSVKGATEKEFM